MCCCNQNGCSVAGVSNTQNNRTITEYIPVTITYSVAPGNNSVAGANTGNNRNCCCNCCSTCSCRCCGLY